MCGIAAIVFKSSQFEEDTLGSPLLQPTCAATDARRKSASQEIRVMLDKMAHRGPDGLGVYTSEDISLGMVRLAIVGGTHGEQPIWNEDKSVAVVCNGEIYNHREWRARLIQLGHVFSTQSDIEIIVHLYELYGETFIDLLEGTFAFVLWDCTRKKVVAARDRLGVKPLYYAQTKHRVLFASELKPLLAAKDVDKDISPKGFAAYHAFRYVPSPDTLVSGIRKLAPAECLIVERGRVSIHSYWSGGGPKATYALSTKVKASFLRQRLVAAVKHQATTDVKTGLLLSGGLDSTALLALHNQLFHRGMDTYTVSFEKPTGSAAVTEYTELNHAEAVAEHYGCRHTEACYTAKQVLDELPSIIRALGDPIADPTAIPLWFACRLAHHDGVKVLYSGEGMDELFCGYEVYQQKHWLSALQWVPMKVRARLFEALSGRQDVVRPDISLSGKAARFSTGGASASRTKSVPGLGLLARSLKSPSEWYQGVGGIFTREEFVSVVRRDYLVAACGCDPQQYVRQLMAPVQHASLLTQMTYFDLFSWLPENTLMKSDKISMAQSIELRVPFLDYAVVDFALNLSDRDKLRGRTGKWIVRQALKGLVPKQIIERKKAGFPVPLTAWIFNEWRDFVGAMLLDADSRTREIYRRESIEKLLSADEGVNDSQRRRRARLIWAMLTLELWFREVYAAESLGQVDASVG